MEQISQHSGSRQANMELLRILAMLGIVVNHFFNYGMKIYDGFTVDVSDFQGTALWTVLELMKFIALPSVNCYILISGYFLITKHGTRWRGMFKVWSETWYYSVAIALIFLLSGDVGFSRGWLLQAVAPVCTNEYWFITSYLALMLVAPFLTSLALNISKKEYQALLVVGVVICFEYPLGQYLLSGQQFLLFCLLFLIGGYIRLYVRHTAESKNLLAAGAILLVMLGYSLAKNLWLADSRFTVYAMAYNGLVLPLSVFVFLIFTNLSIHGKTGKAINAIAPLTLAVYLIHCQPSLQDYLWSHVSHIINNVSMAWLPLLVVGISMAVFLVCVILDIPRRLVGRRLSPYLLRLVKRWFKNTLIKNSANSPY